MQRARLGWKCVLGGGCALALLLALPPKAGAFAFTFTNNGVDVVTHPFRYTGTGGNLNITIGIDSTSPFATQMVTPVQNVISTWNGLVPTTNNLQAANVPFTQFDFESVLLHEVGHTLGLAHPNLGFIPGEAEGATTDYTNSTRGGNGVFNVNAGSDGVIGSRDDVRGDDVNLNYFRRSNNDPFTIDSVVDSTTYSRNTANLPAGSIASANASRAVATLLGHGNTEASLQQGTPNGEARRTLGHDDVAGIRYGMSGLDELEGTADDYTITLTYAGITSTADILIKFEDGHSGFAVAELGGAFIGATDHVRITDADIFFEITGIDWFFNPTAVPEPGSLALMGVAAAAGAGAYLRRRRRAA